MRLRPIVAVSVTIALCAPSLASAQYRQPTGNPLHSIFSCQSGGNKQATGAVVGGVLGGVLGNQVADNERGLGTVLGAALGAAAGSYIGCRMQTADAERAELATMQALNSGSSQTWNNPQTGASGRVTMVSNESYAQPVSLAGLRLAPGVEPAGAYAAAASSQYAPSSRVNLRGGPSTQHPVVGQIAAGERVEALAKVQGTQWILVGRYGQAVGYVSESVVRPVGGSSQSYAGSGPLCRTFDQTYTAPGGRPETQRYTACQTASGEWVVQG